ncbi:FCGR3 protein, partial [Erpornis zantholeuca]|nr:FCGR3 protein [Erpornis zantholeuca]
PPDQLLLQVLAHSLLEGDTVTMRCRVRKNMLVTRVRFYQDEKGLGGTLGGTELSLSLLQLHHSGSYRCGGRVSSWQSQAWEKSALVTVTVRSECGDGDR